MKKLLIILLMILLVITQGCSNNGNTKKYKFAYITDTTGLNNSDSLSAVDALKTVREYYEFQYKVFTPKNYAECARMVQSVFSPDYDLIIGTSYVANTNIIDESLKNPGKCAAVIGTADYTNSTMSIDFKMEESAFLAGVLAASMSKTGVIGYVGGVNNELTNYQIGYFAGAKTVNPKIVILSDYADSYNNVTKGYNLAISQIDRGADIIFSNCGATSLGVSKAVNERKIYVIHSDLYQSQEGEYNLGTTTKNVKKAAIYVIDSYINSDYKPGVNRFGISYDMVDFLMTDNVPDGVKKVISQYRTQIRQYTVQIPETWEKYNSFNYSSYIK